MKLSELSRRRLPRTTVVETATPAVDQAEQRERRRVHRQVSYTGDFDLLREVFDIAKPLAKRVAGERVPAAYRAEVDDVATAVHKAVLTISGMVAEVDASRRTRHLAVDQRGQAVKLLLELAKANRPAVPVIDHGQLVSGTWPEVCVELCRPAAGPLSDLLDRAWSRSRDPRDSAGERLVEALRGIDRAALSLEKRMGEAAFYRREFARTRGLSESDKKRAVLAQMGVEV